MKPRTWSLILMLALSACAPLPATGFPGIASLTAGMTPSSPALPDEAILILAPGNGSRLVQTVHVEGIADSTFEQTLVVELVALGEAELELARQPVLIEAELGQRGPFASDLEFRLEGTDDAPGEVRVYATSPRDGGVTHLTSAHVTLGTAGESDIRPAEAHPEQIVIRSPAPAATVAGGTVRVEGSGLASFEQTLVAEIYDVQGNRIGQAPITVSAPEYGVRGDFVVDVAYVTGAAGPGRVVVLDPSPAFGQTLHLASVEVRIEP